MEGREAARGKLNSQVGRRSRDWRDVAKDEQQFPKALNHRCGERDITCIRNERRARNKHVSSAGLKAEHAYGQIHGRVPVDFSLVELIFLGRK